MTLFALLWLISLLNCDVIGIELKSRGRPKAEGRQLQSFFPQQESSNPNFQSSPADVYFVDGNNQVQDSRPTEQPKYNTKFSPNLQADLYTQQYGSQNQQQQQQQQQYHHQQQLQQQQQLIQQQQHQYQQQQYTKPSKPLYPTPDGNAVRFGETGQHQYSPQSQHYVDNTNFVYAESPQFQSHQPPFDQGYSQVVTGSYLVGERPPVNIPPQQRPQLYSPNHPVQYGGNARPIYQSQHNYNLRPPNGYGNDNGNEGGLMDSISNFFTNVGQTASELFSNRPPVSQYHPPPSVAAGIANRPPHPYNQQFGSENQQYPLGNPVNQFSKAIEEITRNDDYQCIPKVICQMVGSQRRQQSILSSPIFSSIISAVPSSSAGLVYGRAALLGLVSGEHNCHTAYPRCPRNEDDLLYYLNNHRGGFFRFFNGGAAFGDDQNYQPNPNQYHQSAASNQHYNQNYQNYQNQRPPQNQPSDDGSVQSNLAALQNIADAINNSGGINLSNLGANSNLFSGLAGLLNGGGTSPSGGFDLSSLGSNAGLLSNFASLVANGNQAAKPSKAPPNDQGQSLTELVGNLLTGFVGQRFNGRKITKRSIGYNFDGNSTEVDESTKWPTKNDRKFRKKMSIFKLKLAASKSKLKFPEESSDGNEGVDGIEGRILNKRPDIHADEETNDDRFVFGSNRDVKRFMDRITGPTPLPNSGSANSQLHFGNNNNDEFRITSGHRSPKVIKFQSSSEQSNGDGNSRFNRYRQQTDSVRFDETAHRPSKMIFPDRTGTGNLRFDHEEFDNPTNNRYGKILSHGNRRPQSSQDNPVSFGQTDRLSSNSQLNYRPSFNNNYQQSGNYYDQRYPSYNRYAGSNSNQRDDNSSQNIYVTNGEGKIVYYINAQGKKVYV